MEKVYIARKFVAIEGGARHLYEEEVFDSYKLAFDFIRSISEEEDDYFLSEIIVCHLNDAALSEEKNTYVFDRQGTLKWENTAPEKNTADSFTGKFSAGDIVTLSPFPWSPSSPTWVETIGVISNAPVKLEEWIAADNDKVSWDNTYVIEYIRDGYLGHWHVEEGAVECFRGELPENLTFLKILSAHYLKVKILPEEIIEGIYTGNIFVEKVNYFKFP